MKTISHLGFHMFHRTFADTAGCASACLVSSLLATLTACGARTGDAVDDSTSRVSKPITTSTEPGPGVCMAPTSNSGFTNGELGRRSGTFTVELDATPSTAPGDALFGLSNGPASTYASLAAIVRFNPEGTIDVRNGGTYAADRILRYQAGTTYHFGLDINTVTHRYAVRLIHPQGDMLLASNYQFRSEQATASVLDHYAAKVDAGGSLDVCAVTVTEPGTCRTSVPGSGFVNNRFFPEARFFTASFTATPGADNIDGVVGFSAGPAGAFADLAAAVRFNPAGEIDVRNGNDYTAAYVTPYQGGQAYTFQVLVDVLGHSYSVMVGNRLLARNYAFRTSQAGVASLASQAQIVDSSAGPLTVCDFQAKPSDGVVYAHDLMKYGSGGGKLATLPNGMLLMDQGGRTLTIDAQGNVVGTASHGWSIVDGAGNFYVLGDFQGTYYGEGGPLVSAGENDIYVSKYDVSWTHLWTRQFGGPGEDFALSPTANARGDFAIEVGPGPTDQFSMLRLDPDGTTAWTVPSHGTVMSLDPGGNVLFAESQLPSEGGAMTISKIDRSAAPIWSRQFQVTGSANVYLIRSDPSGNPIVAGSLNGTIDFGGSALTGGHAEEGAQAFVAKLDAAGGFVYGNIVDMTGIAEMAVGPSGNVVLSGSHQYPARAVLSEFDAQGKAGRATTGGDVLVPPLALGDGGSVTIDQSGNIYWEIYARAYGDDELPYLVKFAP